MSAKFFSITAKDPGPLTAGKTEVTLTVTNVSGIPLRGQVWLNAIGGTKKEWLRVAGDSEKDFQVNETHSFTVEIQVPADAPPGTYTFRPVVASFRDPNREFDEGQMIAFQVEEVAKDDGPGIPWWVWAIAAAVVVGIGIGIFLWVTRGAEKVTIPELAGETRATAQAALEKLCEPEPCVQVTVREEASGQAAAGSVIRTEPPEGQEIEVGKTVTLVVSGGSPGIVLPDVAGKTEPEARQALETLCQEPRPCVHVFSNTEPSDTIASALAVRTEPPAPAQVQPGSVVGLILSGGPSTIAVPNVENLPEATAKQRIERAGFQALISYRGHDEVGNGRVIETVPPAPTPASPGSKVIVYVSKVISGGQRALLKQQTLDMDDGSVGGATSAADLFFDVNGRVLQAGFQGIGRRRPNCFLTWSMSPLGASQCLSQIGGPGVRGTVTSVSGLLKAQRERPMFAAVLATRIKEKIPLAEVRKGLHVCSVTTEGQVSGFTVVSVDYRPGREQLVVDYKTWPSPKLLPVTGVTTGVVVR